jgi:RNA polymerase sigma factor (sigma-70 family)
MPDPAVMKGVLRHLRRTERRRLYHLLGDDELLARFLADRDEAAFEELVCRHGPMVRAVCRRVLGPTADADDAFQATFLVLLRKAPSIRRTDLLANWLCAVSYRTARQALRRRYRLGARERTGDDLPEPCRPDDPPRDWLPMFDAALQRLPTKYREPVVLCELQGLPRPEAAQRLGLNEGTLSSRLGRARDLLRRKLGPYGFPLAVGTAVAPAIVPEALTASTAAAAAGISAASVSAIVLTEGVLTAMFASKLKAGAACAAVLVVGAVAGFQFSGNATLAGGPAKDGPVAKEAAKETAKPDPTAATAVGSKPTLRSAEYEPFQGEWIVTAAERDGSATTPGGVGVDETWRFAGNLLTTGGETKDEAGAIFTLDVKTRPVSIGFTLAEFANDGSGRLERIPFQGICKFEQDGRLVICYRPNLNNNLRPSRFATAKNSGATLLTLRRPKPPVSGRAEDGVGTVVSDVVFPVKIGKEENKPSPAKNADLSQVIGAWELADVDGETPDAARQRLDNRAAAGLPPGASAARDPQRWEVMRRLYLLPGGGPTTLAYRTTVSLCLAYAELDGTKSPKWITLHAMEQRAGDDSPRGVPPVKPVRLSGIYKLDGEKLVMCLPEAEVSSLLRPTEFKGDGEGGLYVLTYKRAVKPWTPEARPDPPLSAAPFVDSGTVPPVSVPSTPAAVPTALGLPQAIPSGPLPPPTLDPAPSGPGPASPAGPTGPVPVASDFAFPTPSNPAAPGPPVPPLAGGISVPDPMPSRTEAPPAPDLERLQGVWVVIQEDGKPFPADPKRPESMEFLKDRVLWGDGVHGRVRLDEGKSPRQITITMGKPDDPPMTGIYKLEADRLTIALCTKSPKLIPTGFDPDPEAGISVMVLERPKSPMPSTAAPGERPKADPPPKAPVRDLQKEIDQLREQLKRLEKELKGRTTGGPAGPGAQ